MYSQHATPRATARPEAEAPVLRGRGLVLARGGWVLLVALSLGLFAAAVPALYEQSSVSGGPYAGYTVVLLASFGLGCFVVAGVVAYRGSDDPMALFASVFLVLMGAANHPNVQALSAARPVWLPLLEFAWWILWAALLLFVFLFPNGRFVPRWMRVPAALLIAGMFVAIFFAEGTLAEPPEVLGVTVVGSLVAGVAAQIYRYRRVSGAEARQQTKWIVFAVAAAISIQVIGILAEPLFVRTGLTGPIYEVADITAITLAFFLIPLSIGVAILRYRLWDIDLVVNRALVYGTLTTCVIALYVLVVGGLSVLLQAQGNLLVSLLAAGLVAVLFAPLKDRLQHAANRLIYGERDDPYMVLSRLGRRLETTLAPEAVLPAVVETVCEALKLPYAAVEVERNGRFETAAATGESENDPVRLPLIYAGEPVGRLVLGRRSGEADFSSADRRLLDGLTRQVGVAVHASRLTEEALELSEDLQRSRQRLVTAREEERRRLRRDLHDGLGPQLASLAMKAEAARELMAADPARADALLCAVTGRARETVADVRRLVHGLRPPALDDLGLVGALRSQASHGDHGGLHVSVEVPVEMPSLSAAVEVACYRIVQEAVTNAGRHADAHECVVRLVYDGNSGILRLEIADDGRGVPEDRRAGVGLHSMRERAEELGGSFEVKALPKGGTLVSASLLVAGEADKPGPDAAQREGE